MTFHRYVALGDSFTEGVGDPDPERPNGLRGWADRVAEVLATRTDDFGYANLAIRGRKLDGILAEQVEPALALEPDLVTIYAGANDIMRPRVDLDALADRYDGGAGPARRDRRPPPGVDGVRPGRLGDLPPRPRPVRPLQRAGPRGRRPQRRDGRRLLADARVPRLALLGHRPDAHGSRPATSGWRSRSSTPSASRTPPRCRSCRRPRRLTPREQRQANLAWTRSFAVPWVHRRHHRTLQRGHGQPSASGPRSRRVASVPRTFGSALRM